MIVRCNLDVLYAPITTATKLATPQHNGQAHTHSQWRLSQWRGRHMGKFM